MYFHSLLIRRLLCFRYFYISLIREPIIRFLSEFKHVQRGATWKTSRHWCGGRVASKQELPKCYSGSTWKNVSLNEFLSCPHNLAANRYVFWKKIVLYILTELIIWHYFVGKREWWVIYRWLDATINLTWRKKNVTESF